MTATLCLLAFGAVMVYSASSPRDLLGGQGNGAGTFFRYLIFGAIGLAAMYVLERRGLALLDRRIVKLLLIGSSCCCCSCCCRASGCRSTAPGAGSRPGRSSSSPPSS